MSRPDVPPDPVHGDAPHGKKHPKLSLAWKIITISFGVSLLLLGIAGLFLPVLQGWLMIFAGLAVLSPYSSRARWILHTLREKLRLHHAAPAASGGEADAGTRGEEERGRRAGS